MYVPIWNFVDALVFEIFDQILQTLWPRCYATDVAMATNLCRTNLGRPHVSPNCEVDRFT